MTAVEPRAGRRAEPARVLVVDDEESITQLVSTVLRYEGFDGRDGRRRPRGGEGGEDFRPDLVVLDVMLPDLDGFEVYRRLEGAAARLPVLFLTARDSTEDRVHGLTLGADDYMGKPFSLEELVARVRAVLRRTRASASDRAGRRATPTSSSTRTPARCGAASASSSSRRPSTTCCTTCS